MDMGRETATKPMVSMSAMGRDIEREWPEPQRFLRSLASPTRTTIMFMTIETMGEDYEIDVR